MNIITKIVTAGVAALALGGTTATTVANAASASTGPTAVSAALQGGNVPTRVVVALEPCAGTGLASSGVCWIDLRPHFQITADSSCSLWTRHTHWSHWSKYSARGSWVLWAFSGIPGEDGYGKLGRVTIILKRPRYGVKINGRDYRYFTRLHIEGSRLSSKWRYLHWSWGAGEWVR